MFYSYPFGTFINMFRVWPCWIHPKLYSESLEAVNPTIYSFFAIFESLYLVYIVINARLVKVVRQLAIKLMNTVPTIEQSGI